MSNRIVGVPLLWGFQPQSMMGRVMRMAVEGTTRAKIQELCDNERSSNLQHFLKVLRHEYSNEGYTWELTEEENGNGNIEISKPKLLPPKLREEIAKLRRLKKKIR